MLIILIIFIFFFIFCKYLLLNKYTYNTLKTSAYAFYDSICDYRLIESKNEIEKNLWLGDYRSAADNSFLQDNNVKLVVNLSKDLNFTDLSIDKYRVPIHDNRSKESDLGMIEHFDTIYDKMKYYIDNDQGVLVHCRAGMQRSATVVALYIMKKYKINFESARKIIRQKRCIAFYPIINFIGPLKYFETKFKV